MAQKETVMKLGPVTVTSNHDYRRFFIAVLFTMAVGVLFAWGYQDGYLKRKIIEIGPYYAVMFSAMVLMGIGHGLAKAWWLTTKINAAKRPADTMRMFGIAKVTPASLASYQEAVEDDIFEGLNWMLIIAGLAVTVGFIGTIDGLVGFFDIFKTVKGAEDGVKKIPEMAEAGYLAWQTTWVGLIISTVVGLMYAIVYGSAITLKNRVNRILAYEADKAVGNGA